MQKENLRSHFYCKQFSIRHDIASLKVTTEALILGAYAAIESKNSENILDIGTGTGILALMVAQKTKCLIDAIEIEKVSAKLAQENVENSTFKDQIKVYHCPVQAFDSIKKYDLIISNPPFFENHLKSPQAKKNVAIHNDFLPFQELALGLHRLMQKKGRFLVLLPSSQLLLLEEALNLLNIKKTKEFRIHHDQNSKVLRIIATFEYNFSSVELVNFFIKDQTGNYTRQFEDLLKDYYLIFS
ncbi:MAG: methyltransferase [Bacteroidota bacterium]